MARIAVTTAAALCAAVPLPPAAVERIYSARIYVALQAALTPAANAAPFAFLDLLLVPAVAAWILCAWRDVRRAKTRAGAAGAIALRSVVWCASAYLIFLMTWGLNYRRVPLRDKLPYDESRVTAPAARAAAAAAVDRLNALHDSAHSAGWPTVGVVDPQLAAAFSRALGSARLPPTVPGRPKRTLLDWYFRRSGTDGMTDPFFLETLVATSVLPFERPFVIAHEWSHLAGVADEGEANFVGWLTCMRGGPAAQYSGALFLYRELAATIPGRQRAELAAAIGSGARADLRAIAVRYDQEVSPRLAAAGWRLYDSYLRANRIEAGTASYGEVVKLVLGVRLDDAP